MIKPANRLNNFEEYYFSKKLREVASLIEAGNEIINLGIGSPDLPAPKKAIDAVAGSMGDSGVHQYQSYKGLPELRQAVSEWYKHHYGVSLDPDQEILPLIGSKEGIFHLSMAFLDEGDRVLVPDPGYLAYTNCAKLAGAIAVPYDLDEEKAWLPDLDEIENNLLPNTKLMWINYPHMPTGAKANLEFFNRLIEFAQRNSILICHDNPYSFILNSDQLSIFNAVGSKSVAVELNSLSKTYNMSGWRVGFLSGSPEYINAAQKVSSNINSGMFKPVQIAAIESLSLDPSWFRQQDGIYTKRKKVALALLQYLNCDVEIDQAGLFLWAKVPDRVIDVEKWLDTILYEKGIFITPGSIFGSNGKRYIRISLCSPVKNFEEALARFS